MIKIYDEQNNSYDVDIIKFSDGALNVNVPNIKPKNINLKISNVVEDLHILQLVVSALDEMGKPCDTLNMLYMPNARADRVFNVGNAFPLKVTADIINSLNFKHVFVADPHSDVLLQLVKNSSFVSQLNCFLQTVYKKEIKDNTIICSPDKGAINKSRNIADFINKPLVIAEKVRNIDTGKIEATRLIENHISVKDKHVIIVDDICDGGGTFIPLAKLLIEEGAESVDLYVTHGIFAKGLDIFKEYINNIYVFNYVGEYCTIQDIQKFNLRVTRKNT